MINLNSVALLLSALAVSTGLPTEIQSSLASTPVCKMVRDDIPSLNADCALLNLETVPFINTPNKKNLRINLSLNKISQLADNSFINKTSQGNTITLIDLSKSKVISISSGAFNGLDHLEDLNLHGNQLSSVPSEAFKPIPNLKYLYMGANSLTTVPANAFSNVAKLNLLHLNNYNELLQVEKDAFSSLVQLKILYLNSDKKLKASCEAFKGLQNMDLIQLEDTMIHESDKCALKKCLEKISQRIDGLNSTLSC